MSTFDALVSVDTITPSGEAVSPVTTLDRELRELPVTRSSEVPDQRARTVAAKLSLPHMGFVLPRARLRTLVESVPGGGVVTLVGGPGYGKTAFIVDLFSSTNGRAIYFNVDEDDRDPIRFLTYFMTGLGMKMEDRPRARSLEWAPPGGLDGAVLDLTAEAMDFISGQCGQKTLVAIDDFHLVDSSTQVLSALELVTRGLPPAWVLLLSSRRPIPLRLDGVGLGGRFVELSSRELRLTPREVSAWAAQNWGVQLQRSEVHALWRLTQGWPAALALLGQRLLPDGPGVARRDIVGIIARGRDLPRYLERDILAGLDEPAAQTMLAAALLPRVIFPRDEVFLPGPPGEAETVLEDLVARGFFVTRSGLRSYTVHPLVRSFAEREAWRGDGKAGLVTQAAEHLERVGEQHQAASLHLRAGRYREAARPLRCLVLSSLDAAVDFTRDEWLDLIPAKGTGDEIGDPWLFVVRGRALQHQTRYSEAVSMYEQATRLLAAAGDKEGLLPVLLGSAFCLFNQGLWDETLAVMKRCRSLARSPQEKVEVLVAEGNVLLSLCRWDEAVENWERALALAPDGARAGLAQRVHLHRARLFYSLGHYRLAKPWVDKAIESITGTVTPAYAMALNGASILACMTGEYERAQRFTNECCRLVHSRGYAFVEIPCYLSQAAAALGRWDYRSALASIREAQDLASKAGDSEGAFWTEDMLGDICRRNGSAQRAVEHHRRAFEIVDKNRLAVFERVRAIAAEGMDLVMLGRESEAEAALEDAVSSSRRWGLKGSLAPALFYLGWLHACAGREQEAARSLGEAVRIAEEHGHIHFFSQEAKVAVPILGLCDRFGAGSFIREKIMPLLPHRLRATFEELADGKTYPTDVSLGYPRKRRLVRPAPNHVADAQPDQEANEGIESLTDRERQVLEMIALGMPNKVIGAKLFISEKTVKTHANHIFRKLGVTSRLQATLVFQSYQRAGAAGASRRRRRR